MARDIEEGSFSESQPFVRKQEKVDSRDDQPVRSKSQYLQFGCGLSAPVEWVNFDASPRLRIQRIPVVGTLLSRNGPYFSRNARYGDITKGLPIQPESCAAIYCSHVLEHLSLDDFRTALYNTHKYLEPGGRFRLVVPDLMALATEYVNSTAPDAAKQFMENSNLGTHHRPRGFSGLMRMWLGNSRHLWMWDFESISVELVTAGFEGIRRAICGDSGDDMFNVVENVDRWRGGLGVECFRPARSA